MWFNEDISTWQKKSQSRTHRFLCHYQIDCVTNPGTAVGHYATNSYMCTLELLIYMSSPLHRHTLNRPHFRVFNSTGCASVRHVLGHWFAFGYPWHMPGAPVTAGIPTGALSAGGRLPTEDPMSPEPKDVLQHLSTSVNTILHVWIFKCIWQS